MNFWQTIRNTVIASLLMLTLTSPIMDTLWGQAATSIYGTTSAQRIIPVVVDANGNLQAVISGTVSTTAAVSIGAVAINGLSAVGSQPVNISGIIPQSGAQPVVISGVPTVTIGSATIANSYLSVVSTTASGLSVVMASNPTIANTQFNVLAASPSGLSVVMASNPTVVNSFPATTYSRVTVSVTPANSTPIAANASRKVIAIQLLTDNCPVYYQFSNVISTTNGGEILSGVGAALLQTSYAPTGQISFSGVCATANVSVREQQ